MPAFRADCRTSHAGRSCTNMIENVTSVGTNGKDRGGAGRPAVDRLSRALGRPSLVG